MQRCSHHDSPSLAMNALHAWRIFTQQPLSSMSRSSLENALSERRVRLTVSEDCLISAISQGPAAHMFGMDTNRVSRGRPRLRLNHSYSAVLLLGLMCTKHACVQSTHFTFLQVVGRGLWEVVDEAAATHDDGRVSTPGPRMLGPLIAKALAAPGQSWRVSVATPTPRRGSVLGPAVVIGASKAKPAIMQVQTAGLSVIPRPLAVPQLPIHHAAIHLVLSFISAP